MLVDAKTAARLAGVPLRTMYQWIREERLTVTRPAGKQRGALVNALEAQELAGLRKAGKLPRLDKAGCPALTSAKIDECARLAQRDRPVALRRRAIVTSGPTPRLEPPKAPRDTTPHGERGPGLDGTPV